MLDCSEPPISVSELRKPQTLPNLGIWPEGWLSIAVVSNACCALVNTSSWSL